MGEIVNRTLSIIKNRRQNLLNGKVNCIPTPFRRFSRDFVGLEQGMYYDITSFTKGSKTQFTSYTFLYYPILYAYEHPEQNIDIKYLYFSLEEEKERIMLRFMSFLLYKFTAPKSKIESDKYQIRVSPRELKSTRTPLSSDIVEILESDEITDIMNFFEDHIIFSEEANPTGIMKECVNYAKNHGEVIYEDYIVTNEFGVPETRKRFKEYKPNNPEQYIVPIIDTINLVNAERGFTQKQAIDKMSEYCAKELRNKYRMSPVVIQQQAFEQEKLDEYKTKNDLIRPSLANLGDSKYPARDANCAIGLFSPARFHLHQYQGYDIDIMEDNIRFVEILSNRDGEMGGMIALFFDGAVCCFEEMPSAYIIVKENGKLVHKPNPQLTDFYEKIQRRRRKIEEREEAMDKVCLIAYQKWENKKKINTAMKLLKYLQRFITSYLH